MTKPSTPSVLVAHDRPEDFRDMLAGRFPGITFRFATNAGEVRDLLAAWDPEIAFSIKHPGFPGSDHRPIVEHPSVRWIQVGGSGYDHMQPWDPARVTLSNCAGVLAGDLAETLTGAMLALNGGLLRYLDQQRDGIWAPHPFRPLSEQTLLVVGLGRTGARVAANASALGMRVLAVRRGRSTHPAVHAVYTPDELPDVVGRADVVSLHVRLREATSGLFDARMLGRMKKGALLLNTSRGAVVDETALASALARGHLGGAYLDVFTTEPLPATSPLWHLPNVLLTPHASDNVVGWPGRFAEFFAGNLARWLDGRALENVISE